MNLLFRCLPCCAPGVCTQDLPTSGVASRHVDDTEQLTSVLRAWDEVGTSVPNINPHSHIFMTQPYISNAGVENLEAAPIGSSEFA